MPVYHGLKTVFVHIPKNAGSSVAWTLYNENLKTNEISHEADKHETIIDIKRYYPSWFFDKSFKFSIVRNPWDRIVSWFHYYKEMWSEEGDLPEGICSKSHIDKFVKMDFSEWIKSLEKFDINGCNSEIACPFYYIEEQWKYIVDFGDMLLVDYIAKVETIDDDWKNICKEIGIDYSKLPCLNITKRNNYKDYYNDETKSIIEKVYKKDIEFFNYEF